MEVSEGAFDRDLALFDASSALTHFRLNFEKESHDFFCLRTEDHAIARSSFPRLYSSLERYIVDKKDLSLYFWHLSFEDSERWKDFDVSGPAEVFILSSQMKCRFSPGSLIKISFQENLKLKYEDMVYGFVVVAR